MSCNFECLDSKQMLIVNIYLIEYIESQNVVEKEEKNCSHYYLFTLEIFLSIHCRDAVLRHRLGLPASSLGSEDRRLRLPEAARGRRRPAIRRRRGHPAAPSSFPGSSSRMRAGWRKG